MFNIDMAVVSERDPWVVFHHPAVVHLICDPSPLNVDSSTPIIGSPSPVLWVGVTLIYDCVGTQQLGEILAALSINHAGRVPVEVATWTMNHVGQHDPIQPFELLPCLFHLSSIRMWWQLSTDSCIDMGCHSQSIFLMKDYQNMNMEQASFLELYYPQIRRHHTKDFAFHYVIDELVLLHLEYSCYQIWLVLDLCPIEFQYYLLPVWVAGNGDE